MAIFCRFAQKYIGPLQTDDRIVLQVWADAGGLGELDIDLVVAGWTSPKLDVSTKLLLETSLALSAVAGSDAITSPVKFDSVAGKVFPTKQWVSIFQIGTTGGVAGETGTVVMDNSVTAFKCTDAQGTATTATFAGSFAYNHLLLAQVQAGDATLTPKAGSLGFGQSLATNFATAPDSLARTSWSDYDESGPLGPFGGVDAPIVNAGMETSDLTTLQAQALVTRGDGANAHRWFLTEAGKRVLGYPL